MKDEKLDFIMSSLKIDTDNCIVWPFSKDRDGYGWLSRKSEKRAHRVVFVILNGEIGKGMHVLHKCDNPSCVNAKHLFVGTHSDNMTDMAKKGRNSIISYDTKGEGHGKAILTNKMVIEIRNLYSSGKKNIKNLSIYYGVSRQTISDICRRVTWRHID